MAVGATRKELLTESRRILNNLGRRLERMAGGDILPPAFQDYMDLQKRVTGNEDFNISALRSALKGLSDKDLQSTYRDLRYISNLKTSYAKGANKYLSRISPILDRYNTWDEDKKRKFREAYGKIMESGLSGEMFRYEVFDLAEEATKKEDIDEIPVKLEELMLNLSKQHADDGGEVTLNEFLSALRQIK